jgi:glycosyltransferase involved in cell wall biosynthesis
MATQLLRTRRLDGHPFITVVLPVRNEENYIAATMDAVLAQDYPQDRVEILVVDGESKDRTCEIVSDIARRDPRVRLLHNPGHYVAPGLNAALAVARGDVIVRVDGHCIVPQDYVSTCVGMLRDGPADCAGGPQCSVGEHFVARGIAHAMSTPFGVGGAASFRTSAGAPAPREVDHLPYGAWRREVFETIGGFDEELVRNQDDEFSDRLRRAGGRILLHPRLAVRYWSRATYVSLWRQYLGYGFWKVRVIQKRGGRPSSLRHLLPAALLVFLTGSLVLGLSTSHWEAMQLLVGSYVAYLTLASVVLALQQRDWAVVVSPLAMVIMQAAYGVGFLEGLVANAQRWQT